jgi:HAD superfamily hydrolase (TIGR01509 family)
MIDAIFWDNDGVLVDTEHLYFEATRRVLATIGIRLTEQDYVELFMVQAAGAWHLAADRGISPGDIDQLRQARDGLYCQMLADAPLLMAGVTSVLESLHGRYVMGVVTSAQKDHFELIHQRTGLMKYFDFVLTGSDYIRFKPHPEPYARAVALSGAAPGACLAIEDTERGLASAKAAGIQCVVVPSRLTRGSRFAGADAVLETLADFLNWLPRRLT